MVQPSPPRTSRIKPTPPIVFLGLVMFLIAFFLPSVKNGSVAVVYPGYQYAATMLHAITSISHQESVADRLVVLEEFATAMMSFFTLANFSLRFLDGSSRLARLAAGIALFVCFPSNIHILIGLHVLPIYGFYLWVSGTLLMLFPEILALTRRPAPDSTPS